MIVATRAFPAGTARWLDFSAAIALVALATFGIGLADALRSRRRLPGDGRANGHRPNGFFVSEPEPLRRIGDR
jgi:hypothetical protein